MFNNKKQLLFSKNLSLETKKKLRKSEERVINAFETWCCRRMLKIKWTGRITSDEVFQRAKNERLLLKIFLKIYTTRG
jgi:hypothetical protein